MTEQHVETGFLCMSCKSERGYQSCQPSHELDSAWGLFTSHFYQTVSEENSPRETLPWQAGILHALSYMLGPAGLCGRVSHGLSHPVSHLVPLHVWGLECVSLSESTIYTHVYLWGLRPELCLHEECTCSSSSEALRHDVYGRQRQA